MNTNTSVHIAPDVPLTVELVKHPAYWVLTIAQETQYIDIYLESQYQINKLIEALQADTITLQTEEVK